MGILLPRRAILLTVAMFHFFVQEVGNKVENTRVLSVGRANAE